MTEPSPPPRLLDYARPHPNRPTGNLPVRTQLVMGIAAVLTALAAVVGTAFISANLVPWAGILAVILLFMGTALAVDRWHWRGFARGVLIGMLILAGLALLGVGLCFVALSRA